MARPRSNVISMTSKRFYDSRRDEKYMDPGLADYLETDDPAMPRVTERVLLAKMAGENVSDPDVFQRCIRQGQADHALHLANAPTPRAAGA